MFNRLRPPRDIDRLLDDVDRLITEGVAYARTFSRRYGSRPAIDLYDTGTELVVKALAPGGHPEEIGVAIEKNTLTLQGHYGYSLSEDEDQGLVWHRRDIVSGRFAETVTLPDEVETEQVRATFADGVLTLVMPKVPAARTKRIPVQG
jgi:HSP20 family protein